MGDSLRIVTWNANGLSQRTQELEIFLKTNHIDVALISETHLTQRTRVKIFGFSTYHANHPSNGARGGSAVLIKNNIQHHECESMREEYMQLAAVTVKHKGTDLVLAAAYCPPKHKITKQQYTEIFKGLKPRFIIGGDFNCKHTVCGARLITSKGNELLAAINSSGCNYHTTGKPTYWPTDCNKVPDLLDFFISKGIGASYTLTEDIEDLSSDHSPVLLTVSSAVIKKAPKTSLTNKTTDWEAFREKISDEINLKIRLKTENELDNQVEEFIQLVRQIASTCTQQLKPRPLEGQNYPIEIRKLVAEQRRARRTWQKSRNPADKSAFNRLSNQLNKQIKQLKQQSVEDYLTNLSPHEDKNYSLWRATKRFRRPAVQIPPLKDEQGKWVRDHAEKAELLAQHLSTVFQSEDGRNTSELATQVLPEQNIKLATPAEIKQEITGMKLKKAPGNDEISTALLRELPKKALVMLTYLINASFRLKYVPRCFKLAEIIMMKKPGKPSNDVTSYRPISLLTAISKLFEKLLLKRLLPLLEIPDFQFGFRAGHSAVDQVHRVIATIEKALEEKKYCAIAYLDITQAFDKVWHKGLASKLSRLLPGNYCQLLNSYLAEKKIQDKIQ